MIVRVLTGLVLMGAAIAAGINCTFIGDSAPGPETPNVEFAGCYRGPVEEPPGVGDVTIVFEAPPGDTTHLTLTGCLLGTATFSGLISRDNTKVATLTVTSVLAPQMTTLIATRDRRGPIPNNRVMSLATPPGTTPVFRAPLLTICDVPKTCAGMGVMQ
jgi:hypothetical protein